MGTTIKNIFFLFMAMVVGSCVAITKTDCKKCDDGIITHDEDDAAVKLGLQPGKQAYTFCGGDKKR